MIRPPSARAALLASLLLAAPVAAAQTHLLASTRVRGTLAGSDPAAGVLVVATRAGPISVRATPDQIAVLEFGQSVDLDCDDYGGVLWLAGPAGSVHEGLGPTGSGIPDTGVRGDARDGASGIVGRVDSAHGLVAIGIVGGTALFRGYPQALRQLYPGQSVNFRYESVEGVPWIEGFEPGLEGTGMR